MVNESIVKLVKNLHSTRIKSKNVALASSKNILKCMLLRHEAVSVHTFPFIDKFQSGEKIDDIVN